MATHTDTTTPVAAAIAAISAGEAAITATEDEAVAERATATVWDGYAALAAAPAAGLGEISAKLTTLRAAMIEDADKTIGGRADLAILDSAIADLERMRRGGLMAQIEARVAELIPAPANTEAGAELWKLVEAAAFGQPRTLDELAFAAIVAANSFSLISDTGEEEYGNAMRVMAAILDGLQGLGAEIDPRVRAFFPPDSENRGKLSA